MPRALCVDLDGTLVSVNTMTLALKQLLRQKPWSYVGLLWSLRKGKASFKRYLSTRISLDASRLPFRTNVLAFLKEERSAGRPIVLATAADALVAKPIADYLGLFERVTASDGCVNLKGKAKASALTKLFGRQGFDYIGNSYADLSVWAVAKKAYVVTTDKALLARVKQMAEIGAVFQDGAA